jgi:PiT family inorganic phosphate transporter
MLWITAFAIVAVVFVLVCGANDGAVLLSLAVRFPRTPGLLAAAVPPLAMVVVPPLLGTAVAATFTDRLAGLDGERGAAAFLVGVVMALAVVGVLTWRGLPTSLTLAVIGGIAGDGLGSGLRVGWADLAVVLTVGAAAPLGGLAIGYLLGVLARRVPSWSRMPQAVPVAHLVAYTAQCVAYALNDGQKMLAVTGVALQVARRGGPGEAAAPDVPLGWLAVVAVVFALGMLVSLTRMGERLGRGLVLARPQHIAWAETAAAAAVLGSSALGSPVSMTQSLTGGVIGVAASEGTRRVRWQGVLNLAMAWLLTLPSSMALGWAAGLAVGAL